MIDLISGLYAKNGLPNFTVYLKGHSGDEIIVDRISRKSIRIAQPSLTCVYCMQPQVIAGIAKHPAFRGRGFLARILFSVPESLIGSRKIGAAPVSPATREAYRRLIRRLAAVEGKHVLRLSDAARNSFEQWEAEIEAMLADGGELESMRDWGAKLAGATLRIAALCHCVDHDLDQPVSDETIAAAIRIARYLIPHADAALSLMEANDDAAERDAKYLLKWIEVQGVQSFTQHEAYQHGRRRFEKNERLADALKALVERNYIRLMPSPPQPRVGRPPSPRYEVNPSFVNPAPTTSEQSNLESFSPGASDHELERFTL